jgi:lysylphosphatidylglycerol synthetase-like protein (DUF2156 family)
MAGGVVRVVPGKHIRRAELEGVRRVSVAALIMLVLQYGVGIVLNLYIAVPAPAANSGLLQKIAGGPLMLTVHAVLGLGLIGAALLLLVRAVRLGDRVIAVLAAAGLTAIGGAFASGEIFIRNGQSAASLIMALLTGAALLCYIGSLTWVSTRPTGRARLPGSWRWLGPAGSEVERGISYSPNASAGREVELPRKIAGPCCRAQAECRMAEVRCAGA